MLLSKEHSHMLAASLWCTALGLRQSRLFGMNV